VLPVKGRNSVRAACLHGVLWGVKPQAQMVGVNWCSCRIRRRAAYPNQTFTGWIPPASPVSKSAVFSDIEGKYVRITGRIEMYRGKPEIRKNAASQLEVE
jgi:hypothetical protein